MLVAAMITITFNAFSSLRPKLRSNNIAYANARLEIPEERTVRELITMLGLKPEEVEGVFVNHRIVSLDSVLHHNDRVALLPPGTPGPYRVLLGIAQRKKE